MVKKVSVCLVYDLSKPQRKSLKNIISVELDVTRTIHRKNV